MKENKKNITSGDILEMMVRAGLKPESELKRRPEQRMEPIISINGKDVQWRDLVTDGHSKKDRAA